MKVLYFSSIAEITGCNEQEFKEIFKVADLKHQLEQLYPLLKTMTYAVAVNRTVVNEEHKLIDSDEVALLPPFSGG